jgi:hypothetical protein
VPGHDNAPDDTDPGRPPDLIDGDPFAHYLAEQQANDPSTDDEDDTDRERFIVDYRELNGRFNPTPFEDLGQPDRIQEEYEDFLLQAYAAEDDPLWHDYSSDVHSWYSEDSDPSMVYISATLTSQTIQPEPPEPTNHPTRPSVRIETDKGTATALPDTGAAVCVMALSVFHRLAPATAHQKE